MKLPDPSHTKQHSSLDYFTEDSDPAVSIKWANGILWAALKYSETNRWAAAEMGGVPGEPRSLFFPGLLLAYALRQQAVHATVS